MKVVIALSALIALVAGAVPDPIFPEYVPRPEGLYIPSEVHSQVLDFPSSDNPMIRFHINVKGSAVNEMHARRVARSILGGLLLPPWVLDPQGQNPLPELLPPKPEHLPEVAPEGPEFPTPIIPAPQPEFPTPIIPIPQPESGITDHVFRWPDAENQLVKLRVRVNENAFKPQPENLPARSVDPSFPTPEVAPTKTPEMEVFLDIGEQVKYW